MEKHWGPKYLENSIYNDWLGTHPLHLERNLSILYENLAPQQPGQP